MRSLLVCAAAALLAGCSGAPDPHALETRTVTLPNGRKIRAEVKIKPFDMQRGMMFRDSLPRDQGMLFLHSQAGQYPYWMYNVRVPLDIIWMDAGRRIVEISADTPPCQKRASECPNYGGSVMSTYVLELAGGEAARQGLHLGDTLSF